jgi:hypothetical protein
LTFSNHIRLALSILISLAAETGLQAQPWSPSAGVPGSNAIHMDDEVFQAWAVSCDLLRGPGLITYPDSIEVTHGDSSNACGKADNSVVSLGDAGSATLFFDQSISNGPGPDFAVFENSFDGAFLEIGFVEVSSDGETFIRFPSQSETQSETQIGSFGLLAAEDIHNLAGKYMSGWGTPFDLEELKDSGGLDLQKITAVRIVDVIGILDENLGSRDAIGRLINDPFPSPFENCGFDLDAVGVINQTLLSTNPFWSDDGLRIYPVPCDTELFIEDPDRKHTRWELFDIYGRMRKQGRIDGPRQTINIAELPPGSYLLRCSGNNTNRIIKICKTTR